MACIGVFACCAGAAVHYVDVNANSPLPPYTDWETAAATIQDAIDVANAGDLIWVTNGVYQTGGRPVNGSTMTNRVAMDKAVTVQSVNGPTETVIEGFQVPGTTNGVSAVRGAYLADGARLIGFTIEHGATLLMTNAVFIDEYNGGGVWCQNSNAFVSGCVIVSNCCAHYGAGAYSGTLTNCQVNYNAIRSQNSFGAGAIAFGVAIDSTIRGNYFSAIGEWGGGAYACALTNCTISENLRGGVVGCSLDHCFVLNNTNSYNGGGAAQSVLNGCEIDGNQASGLGGGIYDCVLNNCTLSNNWAGNGGGGAYFDFNQTNAPGGNNILIGNSTLANGGGLYLGSGGGGINNWAVTNWSFFTNLAGRDGGGLYLTSLASAVSNCTFAGNSAGGNGGGFSPSVTGNPVRIGNCIFAGNLATGNGGGAYNVALDNSIVTANQGGNGGGVYGSVSNCVVDGNIARTNGGGLYFSAVSLFTFVPNSQFTNNSAVNGGASYGGNFTNCAFVANSALTNGGAVALGSLSHCLVISNQAGFGGGVNSSQFYPATQITAIACDFIGNSASMDGGGIYSTAVGPVTGTNCNFTGNSALRNGGAVFQGSFGGGTISGNSALNGGGTYNSAVSHCTVFSNTAAGNGGGVCNGSISYCVLSNNVAVTNGGGSYNAGLINSLECGNSAANGGGAYLGSLANSTIVGNNATTAGGGTYFVAGGSIISCIIYDNTAPTGLNYSGPASYSFSCTAPLPAGSGNIANDPVFIDVAAHNFRLQTNSPCSNVGSGTPGIVDLDGRRRFIGKIDMGAYEFQGPGMGEFTAWLQQHGLPIDGSADNLDSDGDGVSNWQEWLADTDPANAASVLKMMAPAFSSDLSNLTLTWQSVTNRTYFLQRSEDLSAPSPFSTIQSNIVGQSGTTSFTDTNSTASSAILYRVGIQQ